MGRGGAKYVVQLLLKKCGLPYRCGGISELACHDMSWPVRPSGRRNGKYRGNARHGLLDFMTGRMNVVYIEGVSEGTRGSVLCQALQVPSPVSFSRKAPRIWGAIRWGE